MMKSYLMMIHLFDGLVEDLSLHEDSSSRKMGVSVLLFAALPVPRTVPGTQQTRGEIFVGLINRLMDIKIICKYEKETECMRQEKRKRKKSTAEPKSSWHALKKS